MTDDEINRIEASLSVSLPEIYRETLLHYPFARFANSSDFSLADQSSWIIRETLRYRKQLKSPFFEPNMVVIGDDEDSAPYFYSVQTGKVIKAKNGHTLIQAYDSFEGFMDELKLNYSELNSHWQEIENERRFGRIYSWIAFWSLVFLGACIIIAIAWFAA